MLIPPLPRVPNIGPTRLMYAIWRRLMGYTSNKIPELPTNDPNVAPTPLLHAIWLATQNGGGGLPSQTGHAGEYLTTDGTTASWAAVAGGGDMLAATYDPAGVAAQLAGASGEAINAGLFRTALGATAVGAGVFLAASPAAGRSALGATTVGENFFTLANPGAITFPRINADNTVTARSAADFRGDIGAGTSSFDGTWASLTGRPAIIDAFAAEPDVAGVLTNDGAGVLSYTTTGSVVGSIPKLVDLPSSIGEPALLLQNASGRNYYLSASAGPGGDIELLLPFVSGTLVTTGANLFIGAQTISTAGANSAPPLFLTGALNVGGTGTTNFPHILHQPAGATAVTDWVTGANNGTVYGANEVVGFTGRFIDFRIAGASSFFINNIGVTCNQLVTGSTTSLAAGVMVLNAASDLVTLTSVVNLNWNSDTILKRDAAATLKMGSDAAGVTNQHFKACNRITSDGVGANLTLSGGNGRGGAGGDLVFASYTTGAAATAGVLTERWKIDAATGHLLPGAGNTYVIGASTGGAVLDIYALRYSDSNGVQILTTQQSAVADTSTGDSGTGIDTVDKAALDGVLGSHATAINALLARSRTHGFIAT